jgi:uncharacterized membrane protein
MRTHREADAVTMARLLLLAIASAVGAAAVHLVIVLIAPQVANDDVASRIARLGAANRIVIEDPSAPADRRALARFADPAALIAHCAFDLAEAPLLVVAEPGETPMTLVFMERGTRIFSALTDRAATAGRLDIVLGTAAQIAALDLEADGARDAPDNRIRITAPAERGAIVFKAFRLTDSLEADARAALARSVCAPFGAAIEPGG